MQKAKTILRVKADIKQDVFSESLNLFDLYNLLYGDFLLMC